MKKSKNTETYDFTWKEEVENENGEFVEVEKFATVEFTFRVEQPEYENGYAYYTGGVDVDILGSEGDEMDDWTEEQCLEEISEMLCEEYF